MLDCLKCQHRADLILSGDGRWAQFLWEIEKHIPSKVSKPKIETSNQAEEETLQPAKQEPCQESTEEAQKRLDKYLGKA